MKNYSIAILITDSGYLGATKIVAGQNPRRKKMNQLLLYSALIKNKFVCEVNSFAFNGNSLHCEHDCIFALPLRLSVNHYYKQVIVST